MYETELINSVLSGNQQDYGLLIKKYQPNVFRTAIGFVHNKEDAEEITQDVFIKAYQNEHYATVFIEIHIRRLKFLNKFNNSSAI